MIDLTGSAETTPNLIRLCHEPALRAAHVTERTVRTYSPCCARITSIAREDLAWAAGEHAAGQDVTHRFRRECAGCGWLYTLTPAGDWTAPTAFEWKTAT